MSGASAPMAAAYFASPSVAVIPSGHVSQPHLIPTLCLTFWPGCAMLSPVCSAQGTPVVLLLTLEMRPTASKGHAAGRSRGSESC